ncbi:hypothetical protein [uncultured Prevotella sp.]|uniref:hypothetical protein n=1 Tax=uncultured Prevotella sp. TaxID=159272 RepID=UPI002670138E|nr:hypothetical protein [uncultured Prevotella sp.]
MDYLEAFRNLKPNTKFGRKSPQKAILLLAIIEMYETCVLSDNEIVYDETLKGTFLKVWNKVLPEDTALLTEAYIPFWYMQNEDFWHVVPVRGKEDILLLLKDDQIKPSESKISDCVQYVELDEDLFFLLTMPSGRSSLKRALLETYTTLSNRMIDKLSEASDNSVDHSAIAMDEYKDLLKSSEKCLKTQEFSSSNGQPIFAQLDEEIQLTIALEYYKFQKKHRQEREIFKELFPNVEDLYKRIVISPIKQGDILQSFSFVYENFLGDLKIALMSEDGSMGLIDSINDAIRILNDEQTSDFQNDLAEDVVAKEDAISTLAVSDPDDQVITDRLPLIPAQESRKGKPWNEDEEKKLSTYYQLGYSVEEIAVAFGRTEISIKMRLSKLGLMDYVYEGEREIEEVPSTESANVSLDIFVENSSKQGDIYNMQGERIFSVNGQLKVFHGKVYRFNYKGVCFTVKDLVRHGKNWDKGVKKIVAYPEADLYQILDPIGFINQIEDVVEYPQWENNRILVDGKWYDFEGYYIMDADKAEKTTENHVDTYPAEYTPKGKLKAIDKVAQSSYDYLWLIAIADFMGEKQQCPSLSYDYLACMMIANAWEILNEHPELKEQEKELVDCINFLIEESKDYMDVALDWSSSKDVVYEAIKDYPMAGVFEDTVEELVESAPYNVLKAWIPTEDRQEMVLQSNAFHNACLYAIHPRKVDPYIEVNPNWTRSLFFEHTNLVDFLKRHYVLMNRT